MFLDRLFGRTGPRAAAEAQYDTAVAQARSMVFYRDLGVPDTVDGRFDMIVLHVFMILHRMKREGDGGRRTGQALFDRMFADMDRSLREMGVGDLSVGKQVKRMGEAFYGRVKVYDAAVAAVAGDGGAALNEAIARNVFGIEAAGAARPSEATLQALAAYVMASIGVLDAMASQDILEGRVAFAAVPATRADAEDASDAGEG
ncbi:ubiquinol-cytochrome c chaperone [Tistrella bauzanensis]|uniref:Ubiquinol-cytochrome c chaperone n=1 Tax=Tistrella bauzanensis TaxID=657419 RepID=A0ABQ1I9V2_9PROT|nr:ubiquinol-cytochrome C chaperone family protein [Tistrella bauzanensis]GGB30776.1 ubiquinol-cytochrome c chaperone [Tistrella bauzanensis]